MLHLKGISSSSLTSFICEDYGSYASFFETFFGKLKIETLDSKTFSVTDNSPFPLEKSGKVKQLKTYLELPEERPESYKYEYKNKRIDRDKFKQQTHSTQMKTRNQLSEKKNEIKSQSAFSHIGKYISKCFKKVISFFTEK